jgi:hypothetical protein
MPDVPKGDSKVMSHWGNLDGEIIEEREIVVKSSCYVTSTHMAHLLSSSQLCDYASLPLGLGSHLGN